MIRYEIRVARSAEGGIAAGLASYTVELEDRMTILDALFQLQREADPSLNFRCACRVGMCGTCTISVNGVPSLACKTRANTAGSVIELRPLPHLPVLKDLVVSMEPFFAQWKRVSPRFRPAKPDSNELAVIPSDSQFAKASVDKRDCITCGACFAACGVKTSSGEYLGPAAIQKAYLRWIDPRDSAKSERMQILNDERAGVWRCHTQYNCTNVCPKGITLTDTIANIKRASWRSHAK